mmetsp:Transcript_30390/g.66847  ORF Transcript_30390/g.66847 Transcript_30390/m.66847 type:complete len:219 (+) Transcript_30390:1163-1819(+)
MLDFSLQRAVLARQVRHRFTPVDRCLPRLLHRLRAGGPLLLELSTQLRCALQGLVQLAQLLTSGVCPTAELLALLGQLVAGRHGLHLCLHLRLPFLDDIHELPHGALNGVADAGFRGAPDIRKLRRQSVPLKLQLSDLVIDVRLCCHRVNLDPRLCVTPGLRRCCHITLRLLAVFGFLAVCSALCRSGHDPCLPPPLSLGLLWPWRLVPGLSSRRSRR